MKQLLIVIFFLCPFLLASCSKDFYQLYEVTPEKADQNSEERLSYSQDSIQIDYNFWGKTGNLQFVIKNHSSNYIQINLEKSHFVLNGWANNYYDQAIYTVSRKTKKSLNKIPSRLNISHRNTFVIGEEQSKKVERSYIEKKQITIPPKAKKQFLKFNLKDDLYTHCDLNLNPQPSDSIIFNRENTPLKFQNIVSYSFKKKPQTSNIRFENQFWVQKVTNIEEDGFSYNERIKLCKNKFGSYEEITNYPYYRPNRFYLMYQEDGSNSGGNALPAIALITLVVGVVTIAAQ